MPHTWKLHRLQGSNSLHASRRPQLSVLNKIYSFAQKVPRRPFRFYPKPQATYKSSCISLSESNNSNPIGVAKLDSPLASETLPNLESLQEKENAEIHVVFLQNQDSLDSVPNLIPEDHQSRDRTVKPLGDYPPYKFPYFVSDSTSTLPYAPSPSDTSELFNDNQLFDGSAVVGTLRGSCLSSEILELRYVGGQKYQPPQKSFELLSLELANLDQTRQSGISKALSSHHSRMVNIKDLFTNKLVREAVGEPATDHDGSPYRASEVRLANSTTPTTSAQRSQNALRRKRSRRRRAAPNENHSDDDEPPDGNRSKKPKHDDHEQDATIPCFWPGCKKGGFSKYRMKEHFRRTHVVCCQCKHCPFLEGDADQIKRHCETKHPGQDHRPNEVAQTELQWYQYHALKIRGVDLQRVAIAQTPADVMKIPKMSQPPDRVAPSSDDSFSDRRQPPAVPDQVCNGILSWLYETRAAGMPDDEAYRHLRECVDAFRPSTTAPAGMWEPDLQYPYGCSLSNPPISVDVDAVGINSVPLHLGSLPDLDAQSMGAWAGTGVGSSGLQPGTYPQDRYPPPMTAATSTTDDRMAPLSSVYEDSQYNPSTPSGSFDQPGYGFMNPGSHYAPSTNSAQDFIGTCTEMEIRKPHGVQSYPC